MSRELAKKKTVSKKKIAFALFLCVLISIFGVRWLTPRPGKRFKRIPAIKINIKSKSNAENPHDQTQDDYSNQSTAAQRDIPKVALFDASSNPHNSTQSNIPRNSSINPHGYTSDNSHNHTVNDIPRNVHGNAVPSAPLLENETTTAQMAPPAYSDIFSENSSGAFSSSTSSLPPSYHEIYPHLN
ncbi:uncharacterized protein NEPG_00237 [Nematocida parisii ERTm1]|uniref:Uncharacterized protein n=1 Tax=Nematocida parisii (strain ERTm3) TaxID=935791 RepID=I3EGW4_NEMP3|nr:uncharacterized protein NEPG_00237 [Nematocida parisii ERTm1]EIJ88461.1 hypothetical protein NEQG_01151 [Nematocida parisii ERTm3]EIJ94714.1 hypothetical protein NEPG_00237 [Nematocida parisii ERTm1]KAI5145879.1 hypothetical protein NEPAR07_1920 [Nematocida parisii]KAI5158558.1 hypothetical protein NEPAR05_2091 [Nematocida parisii]|eukprot:XP_013058070.1 hypothetical protein NEPG_00237 [Nematocida parisii ERTm1]